MPIWIIWLVLLLTVGAPAPTLPGSADQQLRDALVALALHPGPDTLSAVPFAGTVGLGLGPDLLASRGRSRLAQPASWQLDPPDGVYRASIGPFNALSTLARHARASGESSTSVATGDHDDCFGNPVPRPVGLDDTRRVSIRPTEGTIDSCIDWFSVDAYVRGDQVVAVTLDIGEP